MIVIDELHDSFRPVAIVAPPSIRASRFSLVWGKVEAVDQGCGHRWAIQQIEIHRLGHGGPQWTDLGRGRVILDDGFKSTSPVRSDLLNRECQSSMLSSQDTGFRPRWMWWCRGEQHYRKDHDIRAPRIQEPTTCSHEAFF